MHESSEGLQQENKNGIPGGLGQNVMETDIRLDPGIEIRSHCEIVHRLLQLSQMLLIGLAGSQGCDFTLQRITCLRQMQQGGAISPQ